MIIGTTISFAGNPKMKAKSITPSSPSKSAKGSRKLVHIVSIDKLPTYTLDNIYIMIPAGMATTIALPNTYKVLSNILLIITFKYCGLRYGGSSNINDDGIPFKIVLDNILDIIKVINTEKHITNTSNNALNNEEVKVLFNPTKNIVIIAIIIGNLPLHGTKELVRIAINLSLLESIIRHPVTPTALQPNPIHIVSACLPQALHFLKNLSKLKAILGKYPKSSNIVNKGKNMAIGGNITDTTHARTLYAPNTTIFLINSGKKDKILYKGSSKLNKKFDNNSDG